ncbi:MAG: discoidin domain-containing protein [Sedimentisphaerales bacterium]|nr:discoidin domain-containing protein [Sedimentisphaerales bacterium]
MLMKSISVMSLAVLFALASGAGAEPFDLLPTFDTEIGNDAQVGPNSSSNGTGMGIRDISSRRRVAYVTYDISEVKAMGAFFSNVRFSNYGHDLSNPVAVYGVLEAYEDVVAPGVNWATGPGVQNNPVPALDSPVELDPADLTDVLLVFTPPAMGVREETETSEALADFLNSDTNGFVAFLFAPAEPGNQAIVRTTEMGENGGTRLLGDIGGSATTASKPVPTDGATDIPREVVLSWTAGGYAVTHDVYLGTSFDDVNTAATTNPLGVLAGPDQPTTTFDPPGLLEFDQTYYWRVDEVNGAPDFMVFPGNVWSFTTEPFAYLVPNVTVTASTTSPAGREPENVIDGSGLGDGTHSTEEADMWLGDAVAGEPVWIQFDFPRTLKMHQMRLWNYNGTYEFILGLGLNEVTLQYTADGEEWIALGDQVLDRAPGAVDYEGITLDLAGVPAQAIRIDIHSNRSTSNPPQLRYGLAEAQFYYIPAHAREPQPAAGAADMDPDVVLSWRAGREAASHSVYFSSDEQAVADGTAPASTVATSSFDPDALILGQTYYWRVDEVNEAATPSIWPSDVWSFATKQYFTVDDFESYTDNAGEEVFSAWLDGYEIDDNGSIVGNPLPPYTEQSDVHGGSQAMPFSYTNTGTVRVSEAARTLEMAQDWTRNGADTLTLWYKGDPIGFLQVSQTQIVMNGMGADIFSTADQGRFVYKQLSGNGSIVARVDRLDATDPWAKAGVMIRQTLQPDSIWAYSLWAPGDGNRFRFQNRATIGGTGASDTSTATPEQTTVDIPVWLKLERSGNQFNAFYATAEAPTTWIPSPANPQTITMADPVYVGLAVTSHVTTTSTQAVLSEIATTGNVSGQWQSVSLTVDQPAGNGVDKLYVAVEDSSGRKATVVNPDPYAVGAGVWTEWNVPLSTLSAAGVNTSSIKKVYLGVGDRNQASANASGALLIDDLLVGRPAAEQ